MEAESYPRDKGLGWVVGQVVLMTACGVAGWWLPGEWSVSRFDWVAALTLIIAAAVFGIGGVWVLGANRTIYPEPRKNSVMVQHGIYRHVRHPLYSSVLCMAFAWGIWRHSGAALCIALILTVFLTFKAGNEERRLIQRFPEYAAYRKTARKFLPGVF